MIIDGVYYAHSTPPIPNTSYKKYAERIGLNMKYLFITVQRIDSVFDVYKENSLKAATTEKKAKGVRRRVAAETKEPGNWSNCLRDERNKQELFAFLAMDLINQSLPEGKTLYDT